MATQSVPVTAAEEVTAPLVIVPVVVRLPTDAAPLSFMLVHVTAPVLTAAELATPEIFVEAPVRAALAATFVQLRVPVDTLEELLAQSDIVSLHVPETPQTANMIGEAQLRLMRKGAFLINNSRGTVVDLDALARALKDKHLAGAAEIGRAHV